MAPAPSQRPERYFIALRERLIQASEPLTDPEPLRHAAVLALLMPDVEVDDCRLLLIERSRQLRAHGGQLAFPGGKPEPGDASLLATALREAHEEVGLRGDEVDVLGRLDEVPTPSGFMIVPFVGVLRSRESFVPRPSSEEVERVLVPRLSTLADPSIHSISAVHHYAGRRYELHNFDIGEPPLWGATARMVWDLMERLGGRDALRERSA